jgi:hypothetical protein
MASRKSTVKKNISWNPAAAVKIAADRRSRQQAAKALADLPVANTWNDNNMDNVMQHLQTGNAFSLSSEHMVLLHEKRYGYPPLQPGFSSVPTNMPGTVPAGSIALFLGMYKCTEAGRKHRAISVNRPLMMINGIIYVMMSCIGMKRVK